MLSDFAEMAADNVSSLAVKLEKRTAAQGRIILPQKLIRNIQALCFWCSKRTRKGELLVHMEFTLEAMQLCKVEMQMRKEDKTDAPIIKPEKFNPKKWKTWLKQFHVYLANQKGAQFAPLEYVIRPKDALVIPGDRTERELQLFNYPLNGAHFKEDNMMVY